MKKKPSRKTKPERHKDLDVLPFADMKSWLAWLESNHPQEEGIWLKFAKKNSQIKSITYEDAREGAIMYGWIDGLINGLDEKYYLTKFTPRRRRSQWSKINRGIAELLIKRNRMRPSGSAQVIAAKLNGRWAAAYDSQSVIETPPELKQFFKTNKKAKQFFDSISQSNRYAFLYRIQTAKRLETRQRRIDQTIEMLNSQTVHHPKLRKKK